MVGVGATTQLPRKGRLTISKGKTMGNGRTGWGARVSRVEVIRSRPAAAPRQGLAVNPKRSRAGSVEYVQAGPEDEERKGDRREKGPKRKRECVIRRKLAHKKQDDNGRGSECSGGGTIEQENRERTDRYAEGEGEKGGTEDCSRTASSSGR